MVHSQTKMKSDFKLTWIWAEPATRIDSLARLTRFLNRGSLYSNRLPYTIEEMTLDVAQFSGRDVAKGSPGKPRVRIKNANLFSFAVKYTSA